MSSLKAVKTYYFQHPCILCGKRIELCYHYRHFKLYHCKDIDLTIQCYLCLQVHKPLRLHRKNCAADIAEARKNKIPPVVLEGNKWYSWKRNWYKQYADVEIIMNSDSLLHLFDNMTTYPKLYSFQTPIDSTPGDQPSSQEPIDQPLVKFLKIKSIDWDGAPAKPLVLNETHFYSFVQWILHNDSEIYNKNVKRAIECLLEYREGKWYHLIVSRYHFRQFATLVTKTDAGFSDFQCLCISTADQVTERTIHAHFLVHINDFKTFRKVCWNLLKSPNSQRFKMCTSIKSFYHMYNVVFYLSQKRACADKKKSKHYDIKTHLTQNHENLTLLVFRSIFYDNILQNFRNKASIVKFNVHKIKDEQKNYHYVSPIKQVLTTMNRTLVFENVLLEEDSSIGSNSITFSNKGILRLVPTEENVARITMADIILRADKFDTWIVWETRKIELIHTLTSVRGMTNTVAVHVDDHGNIGFFGDMMRMAFRLDTQREIAVEKFVTISEAKTIIVADREQRNFVTKILDDNSISIQILSPLIILTEGKNCLYTAKSIYELASHKNRGF